MYRLIRTFLLISMIFLFNSCAHPETGKRTDPFTAFWYTLDGPSNPYWASPEYQSQALYHIYNNYPRVVVQEVRKPFTRLPD